MGKPSIHRRDELTWPTLQALRSLGDSGRIDEITEAVVEREGFSEEEQEYRRNPDDRLSVLEYNLAWARVTLKHVGAIDNSSRGVWTVTDLGRQLTPEELTTRIREWRSEYNRQRRQNKQKAATAAEEVADRDDDNAPTDWATVLLDTVMAMPPDAFERLAQRLLREAGFRNVEVLGKSGDGGIDGAGVYQLSPLVSFPYYFQCKRWANQVGAAQVRDFRGAMAGRGDKGLLITTARFSPAAKEEANRDGAPPIELIDGDKLCQLLKDYEIGIKVSTRVEEDVEVLSEFFAQL